MFRQFRNIIADHGERVDYCTTYLQMTIEICITKRHSDCRLRSDDINRGPCLQDKNNVEKTIFPWSEENMPPERDPKTRDIRISEYFTKSSQIKDQRCHVPAPLFLD